MMQSSYSMRCSRQGVVSKTGGIDTGELINPKKDILFILLNYYNATRIFNLIIVRVMIVN